MMRGVVGDGRARGGGVGKSPAETLTGVTGEAGGGALEEVATGAASSSSGSDSISSSAAEESSYPTRAANDWDLFGDCGVGGKSGLGAVDEGKDLILAANASAAGSVAGVPPESLGFLNDMAGSNRLGVVDVEATDRKSVV